MRKLRLILVGLAFILVSAFNIHAQDNDANGDGSQASSLTVELQALEQTTPIPASQLPDSGTFYSAQHSPVSPEPWPPLPSGFLNVPGWSLGGNVFVLDDLGVNYSAMSQAAAGSQKAGGMMAMDEGGGFSPDFTFDTNGLYLQITGVTNGLASLNLFNGTDTIYAVWSSTNLATPLTGWQVMAELWPTNDTTNTLPFTVNAGDNANLFLLAQDWTGVETNGLPAWWVFYWFGNLSETADTLDASGNTLLADYEAQTDPNVISFWIQTTNNYVNTMNAPVRLVISGGDPADIAVSVDDTNYAADANWQAYTGTNVNVNLGLNEGWHNVWIGLKGLATNATVTWEPARLKLDLTPPTLAITNPTTSVVAVPLIQLQGWSDESLQSLTYAVSNAVGVITNQAGQLLAGQFFDTNTWDYTTDYFQCYDLPLTNGLNTITVSAVDLAGNVTVTNFNYTLDYSTATNPVIQLTWPYDGAEICGGSFTVRGWVDDATAGVLAMITDTNGDTNVVNGVVERNGNLWVENLPLNAGTNEVTLWVTNAAGLGSETNFSVVQNTMTLTLDNISGDLWLPTVSVSGHISDPSAPVWVNGVQGTNNGDGTWSASNVPVSAGGVASFDVSTDPTNAPDPITTVNQDKPTEVTVDSWQITSSDVENYNNDTYETYYYTLNYSASSGGTVHSVGEDGVETETTDIKYAPDLSEISEQDSYQYVNAPEDDYTTETTGGAPLYPDYGNGTEDSEDEYDDYTGDYIDYGDYTEHEVMALHVGGKSSAGQKVLAQVETSVTGSAPTLVDGPHYGSYTIPPQQVNIPGFRENLDASGVAYAAVAVGSSVDVTPTTAGAPYYEWTKSNGQGGEDSGAYTLRIFANQYDLSVTNPEFCVGQQVNFGLYWSPSTPPISNMVGNWNLPDKFVNQQTNYSSTCTTYVINDDLLKNTNQTSCWFVNGAGGKVVVGMNLLFTNGQNASIAANGSFKIYRPTVHFSSISAGPVQIEPSGQSSPPNVLASGGFHFTATITMSTNFSGNANWVQLIERYVTGDYLGLNNLNTSYFGIYSFWLDNDPFYNTEGGDAGTSPVHTTIASGTNTIVTFGTDLDGQHIGSGDDPQVGCYPTYVSISDSFKTYLVFNPGGNGIWVTLGIVNWGWTGSANVDEYGNATLIPGDSNILSPTYTDTDEFPVWSHIDTNSR